MMISLQNDARNHLQLSQQLVGGMSRVSLNSDHRDEAPSAYVVKPEASLSLKPFKTEAHEVDEDMLLALAHQSYKAGNYKQSLDHCNAVYERNSLRTDNLLLMGAIYYQLHDFDMCIARNEEALQIDPRFAECYGNMANAWKEKGNVDLAIRYYLIAIELRPNFCDAWSNLASAYMRKGRLNEAAQCCRQALAINPLLVDAHSNLGNFMKAQGLIQEAYSCYIEALRIQPNFAIAWSNLAGLFMESGDLTRALQYYKEAVKLKPTFADAYLNLGNVYKALGMPQEAIVCYQRALQTRPEYAMAYGNMAGTYYEQGQMDMAIVHYKQAIECDSGFLEAYNNLGNALKDVGRIDEAIQCYHQCLALQPNHPQALTNLGNIYMEWNMVAAAATYYKATLAVTTGLSAPFSNLAIIYKQQGNYADAISCYNEVLRIDPLAADGLVNRGNTFKEIGRVSEAIQDYIHAITIRPTMAEAHANLASAYKDSGHVEAAVKSYKQALVLRPDFPEATCNLLHTLQCVCSWEDREKMFIEVEGIIRRQIKMSVLPSVQPFHAIAYPIDPLLALDISRKYAAHCSLIASRYALPSFNHPNPVPVKSEGGSGRLRIGYLSSDFGNHPLSHLMGSVFGMHNRENVEVFCYALSPNDSTEWRQRIQSEAEHFIDVSAMSSDMIAKLINEDKIQILINLNGYTKGARNEIFAMQPAPIQVSYMGFPGTTGASYIDYLVTDEFVSPLCYAHIYSEKLVHLPHCYFVNDYKQKNRDVLDPNCQHKRSDSLARDFTRDLIKPELQVSYTSPTHAHSSVMPNEEPPSTDLITLTRSVLAEQFRLGPAATGDLTLLLNAIQVTSKFIATNVRKARLINLVGLAGETNVQGEEQKKLDVLADDIMVNALRACGKTSVLVSEERDEAVIIEDRLKGKYCVVFDPLDGSSNIDAGVNIGTIFGIYKVQDGSKGTIDDVLRPGSEMVAAGYTMYGSSANLVLTMGNGVNGYTLDNALGEFILTHPDIKIPPRGKIYSFNEGNSMYFHPPVLQYLESIKYPKSGKSPYSARYIGSMVADVHRTLLYGGIFGYPDDKKSKSGKLRILYEAFPMAMLTEQAGGMAITGTGRILDIKPTSIHQRCPVFLGSKEDVEDLAKFYKEHAASSQ